MLDRSLYFSMDFWHTVCLLSMRTHGAYTLNHMFGHQYCVLPERHTEMSCGNQTTTVIITIYTVFAYATDMNVKSLSVNCVFQARQ